MNMNCAQTAVPEEPTIRVVMDKNEDILNNIEDGVKLIGYAIYGGDKFLNDDKKQSDIPGSIQSGLMKMTTKLAHIDTLIEEIVRGLGNGY